MNVVHLCVYGDSPARTVASALHRASWPAHTIVRAEGARDRLRAQVVRALRTKHAPSSLLTQLSPHASLHSLGGLATLTESLAGSTVYAGDIVCIVSSGARFAAGWDDVLRGQTCAAAILSGACGAGGEPGYTIVAHNSARTRTIFTRAAPLRGVQLVPSARCPAALPGMQVLAGRTDVVSRLLREMQALARGAPLPPLAALSALAAAAAAAASICVLCATARVILEQRGLPPLVGQWIGGALAQAAGGASMARAVGVDTHRRAVQPAALLGLTPQASISEQFIKLGRIADA